MLYILLGKIGIITPVYQAEKEAASTRKKKKNLFTEMIIVFPNTTNQYPAEITRCCKERCGGKRERKKK